MVLNDITNDYLKFTELLSQYNTTCAYVMSARTIIHKYHKEIDRLTDTFLKSPKYEQDKINLYSGLSALENSFSALIANMSTSLRTTTLFIQEVNSLEFASESVESKVSSFCMQLNGLMDITEEYIDNRIRNVSNTETFFKLISSLEKFQELYSEINSNCSLLEAVEEELLEALPSDCVEEDIIYELHIRSYKPEVNVSSFTDDLKMISDCLQNLERLVSPSGGNNIYLRKIESGSLKAVFGSNKVDFSIFPDLIASISNAIKTWRMTPVEIEKAKAETAKIKAEAELVQAQAEEQRLKNNGKKYAIIKSQIEYVCEKLELDPQKDKEQIEHFLHPLISYIESNPVGMINGVSYDVSKEVHLLEDKQE